MTVAVQNQGIIELSGDSSVEDAELLQRHLLANPNSTVEWSNCEHLHSAVLQVLLVAEVLVRGTPKSAFLRTHIAPVLAGRPSRR